jgi:hypothetical protein
VDVTVLYRAPTQWVLAAKWVGQKADYLPLSSGSVKNEQSSTSIPLYAFKACTGPTLTLPFPLFFIIYSSPFWISVVLLLDEPTWDLDPLNTYLVISILSNHARKYGRIVVLTMEKPRSDVFPFLDRVAYLCLGDVVYTGGTRLMLDYFRSIGFPCPELENPLMYYCKYKHNNRVESWLTSVYRS